MKTDATIPPPPEVSSAESSAVGLPARTGGGTRFINLAGRRFGRLVVVSRAENDSRDAARWHVKCDCGEERIVLGTSLRSGVTASCGCYKREQTSLRRLVDLTGRRFGRWVVLSRAENDRRGHPRWHVKCDCGKACVIPGANLRSGTTTSCGCYSREQAALCHLVSLTGRRFGRLVVVSRAENTRWGEARWHVKCDCGEERIVAGGNLRSGTTTSCGCFRREAMSAKRGDKNPSWKPELTQEDRDRSRLGTPNQRQMANRLPKSPLPRPRYLPCLRRTRNSRPPSRAVGVRPRAALRRSKPRYTLQRMPRAVPRTVRQRCRARRF